MNPYRRIILATALLIAGVSVAAFSQVSKTKDLKKVSDEKVQSEKDKQDPSTGLKKLNLRSEDARDWEDWQDVDFDFDFDFEEIGSIVSESIEASLKSIDIRFESMAIPIGPIQIDMDPIEPIDIDIEPIDIDIDMDEDMDVDIDMGPGHGKHKDKHKGDQYKEDKVKEDKFKEDKNKVKAKDRGDDKIQEEQKEKGKEDKSKGLKKIKGN